MIEIIVLDKESAIQAEEAGASRLELVSSINSGGLTPTRKTIAEVCSSVSISVYIMIRPHSNNFVYSPLDKLEIFEGISVVKEEAAAGIVFGALTMDNKLDEILLSEVVNKVGDLPITFHRAIDEAKDPIELYSQLINYPNIKRVLTSGGKPVASEGIDYLKRLIDIQKEKNGPIVMPGSGINIDTLPMLHASLNASEYHIGSGARVSRNYNERVDAENVRNMIEIISGK
ncbi:copper homeostasis protein [Evansella vedderi]|uniref:Copper homeostasis protein cutC homolog n=1 Tax=Evansella vedderi TaxID=38282 RepID=A0ABT9ZXC2_9BACI|nr:copper homeostasis protein CutC [Evansella vedderi]MDQ0255874.1 copper homeostasis protein [Evansella vedderi]